MSYGRLRRFNDEDAILINKQVAILKHNFPGMEFYNKCVKLANYYGASLSTMLRIYKKEGAYRNLEVPSYNERDLSISNLNEEIRSIIDENNENNEIIDDGVEEYMEKDIDMCEDDEANDKPQIKKIYKIIIYKFKKKKNNYKKIRIYSKDDFKSLAKFLNKKCGSEFNYRFTPKKIKKLFNEKTEFICKKYKFCKQEITI